MIARLGTDRKRDHATGPAAWDGDELVDALLTLTKNDDERVRLAAIQAALDRGWGRPAQAVDLGVEVQITSIERKIVDPRR